MFTRGLACVLLLSGCFDLHLLDGRACSSDSDCGAARVCHRGVCTMGGSFVDVPVPLDQLSSEGGAALGASVTRDPTRPSLTAFAAGPPLPGPRTGSAAAQGLLLSGTGTAEVLGPLGPTTPLPSARSQHAATAAGGKLFVLGGLGADGTTLLAEVLSAPLSGDGGVGPWSTETPLPAARAGLTAFAAGGFVYAVGGEAATGLLDEVLAAPLSGAGALGAWKVVARLPEGRARAGGASFDGRLYLAGGSCSGTCAPLRAALLSDGGVGAFEVLPPLSERESPSVVIAGGSLLVLGGRRGTGQLLSDAFSLPLGEAAPWQALPRLPHALAGAAALEKNGTVELFGGRGADGGVTSEHWVASTTLAGAEPFTDAPSLPAINEGGRMVAWQGALYAIGGTPRDMVMDAIWRSAPLADGGFSPWALAGRLAVPRGQVGAAAWGGHLYVVAGCGVQGAGDCLSVGDLSVGDFFPDGGVGNFRSAGSLPGSGEAAELAVAISNGTLLVTGGIIGYGPARKDVLRARLDPVTGMPSALTATTALPETPGLLGHALLAHRGFLYTVGGQTNTEYGPYSDRVLAARLSSDGTVGAWSTVARLPEARGSVSAVLFDDTIYAVMGCNETTSSYCGTFVRAMVAAPVLDDGGVGPFTPVTNHPNPRRNAAVAVLGGRLVTAGGYDGNPEDFVEASTLYGRGRLGAASLLPPAPAGKVAFASAAGHLYAFGADGSVHTALPGGAWEAVTSLPEVAAASSSNGVLYAVSSTQLYRSGAPDVSWAAGAPLPRTVVKPALAGPYLADGTDVFANLGGAWQTAPALPCGAEALALAGQLLFAFCGDTGDVLVSSLAISGAPGDWRRAEGLPGPRHGFGVTFSDGVLYVAGGEAVDVLASVVHPDGTLGPWAIATTLGGPRAPSSLLSVGGRLVSSSAAELVAWPKWTAPSRGVVSARVDLGSGVNLIEGLTLQGSGEVEVDLRLAKDDGAFGEWVPLGRTRLGSELVIGKSAHFVWLRITLLDDARITSGIISTRL